MAFKAFRGDSFNHSHENHAFNILYDKLKAEWQDRDEQLYLFGNFFVAGKEFDALIVKSNAIIVIDFKNFGGRVTFSENGTWYCDDTVVKGGNSRNPFLQIRSNKFALLDYIKNGYIELPSKPNLGHIAGIAMFHQPIELDIKQIPQQIQSWFHICDLNKAIRTIDAIASTEINLSPHDLDTIATVFSAPEYFPDGKPATNIIIPHRENSLDSLFTPIGSQQSVLEQANHWLKSDNCAFIIKGMSSTGKRTLLQQILKIANYNSKNVLLIAPNARLANKYNELKIGEFNSIYQVLYSNKSDGIVKKSNGVELSRHPIILTNEQIKDKILVIVEAHLISNSYYDMDNLIFGTGHMTDDLLTVFEGNSPKLLLVGDPYQLSRGNLDECLLSAQALKDKKLKLQEIFLEHQIESDPKELHQFQFEIAQQMQLKQFNRLPVANNSIVTQIVNNYEIGKDITTGQHHAIYLTALNDVAHKINIAVKQKILDQANPYTLNIGDLVDFHTSTPEVTWQEKDNEVNSSKTWIHSGEIARVTYISEQIDLIKRPLNGRDKPTSVHIGYFKCNVRSLGEVTVAYIVNYLHAEKPELTQDQILALNIEARKRAKETYKHLEIDIDKIGDKKSENYIFKKKEYDQLIQDHILHSPLINAARIRYAYAMTVHRAQGRNWSLVYLDASRGSSGGSITNDSYFRFLYTASMCADNKFRLLKYPKLTPLYQAQFTSNNNCKIGAFNISKGFSYQVTEAQELEKPTYPASFNSDVIELKSLCFCIINKLKNSDWHVSEVKHHSYQELYTFEHSSKKKIKARFTYDKNINVKNLFFLDEEKENELVTKLKTLLESPLSLSIPRLNSALDAIKKSLDVSEYSVAQVKGRSEWEILVSITNNVEAIELKVYVGKDGMISTIMPEKASSENVINFFRELFNES